ncbi:MAG: sigma-70 family RNA polymerase sigma factor [Pseudomonadota bacterium]
MSEARRLKRGGGAAADAGAPPQAEAPAIGAPAIDDHGGAADRNRVTALYSDYAAQLSATLRSIYGDGPPDPDDVAQQAFQNVMERGDIGSVKNLKAFVWRTARNLIFKAHRTRETRARYDYEIDQLFFPLRTDELTPERIIVAREQLQAINRALLEMPPKRRRAFLLHRLHGLTVSDVARRLGVSRSTADEHIVRAATEINRLLLDMTET